MKRVLLDPRRRTAVGPGCPVFIIAEAGVNHNGSLRLARKLVDVAAESGSDAVKFQTFKAELVAGPKTAMAAYQKKNTGKSESQRDMLAALELSEGDFAVLRDHCRKRGILFLSTPFDEPSADLLERLGVPAFKISSGDVTNAPLLRHVGRKKRPVILSTGMSDLSEVKAGVRVLRGAGCPGVVLMQCVTDYPAAFSDLNLRAIPAMAKATGCPVGFSDHAPGVAAAAASVALGACAVEKHFTLDRGMEGPDHLASLDPGELALLVRSIREVELSLGDGVKRPRRSERENLVLGRRSLHWSRDLPEGHVVAAQDLVCLCPGTGLAPYEERRVVGGRTHRRVRRHEMVRPRDLRGYSRP